MPIPTLLLLWATRAVYPLGLLFVLCFTGISPLYAQNLTLIAMNPTSGSANLAVTLTAVGFQPSVPVNSISVIFTPTAGAATLIPATVQGTGISRTLNFVVPAGLTSGVYAVSASGSGYSSTNTLLFTATGPPSFALTPNSGVQGATVQVAITGANTTFPNGTTASFGPGISVGGAPEGQFGPVAVQPNGTAIATLVINSAAPLGGRTVQVNGQDSISQVGAFTVTSSVRTLTLIGINPPSGVPGTAVSITATGFDAGVAAPPFVVTLTPQGGGPAISVPGTVQGSGIGRTINFIVPGIAAGPYSVTASAAGYGSANSLPFTVLNAPAFTLNPASGSQNSTLQVIITGFNTTFQSGMTARFGPGVRVGGTTEDTFGPVEILSQTSARAILTILPGAILGGRTVQLSSVDQITQANAFTVTPVTAQITNVSPNSAQQGQSLSVTITGSNTNFSPQSIVSFGPGINVASVVFNSAASLTANIAITPAAAIGFRDITVTTNGVPVTGANLFSVTPSPPQITSIAPSAGQQGQSLAVTITGSNANFTNLSAVSLGSGVTTNSVSVNSANSLTANITIAPGAIVGVRDVTVTTNGTPLTGVGLFTVNPAPPQQLLSVTPPSGQVGATVSVTIIGSNTNFTGSSTVSFGPGITVNTLTFNNSTTLTASLSIAANAAEGPRDVSVSTGGVPVIGSGLFTVLGLPAQITQVQPNTGQQGESLAVTITGSNTNFTAQSAVSFGAGITVTSISVGSPSSLTVNINIAGTATVGSRDVTVTTGSASVTGIGLFTVAASTPALTSVNPNTGIQGQTLNVAISGANTNFLQSATQVNLGAGISVNSILVNTGTSLVANITIQPQAALGGRTVTVTTGSQTVSLAGGFSVVTAGQSGPLTCRANAGVPPLLRAEGFTELVGDILVICTGGTAGQTNVINLQLFLNTRITSRIVDGLSEALLIFDEVASSAQRAVPQGDNAIVWPNVQVTAPGPSGQRVFRITNVRSNVTSLATRTMSIAPQLAFLSASPSDSLPIGNSQLIVGFVQPGMVFDVTNCSATASASPQFSQCMGENSSGDRDLINSGTGSMQFAVRFTEGFQTAFKPQLAPGQSPSTPGIVYNSESGFLRTPDLPYLVGGADSGTRLAARFTNVPKGVRIFVTTRLSYGSTSGINAVLVRTGANGEGPGLPNGVPNAIPDTPTLFCPDSVAGSQGIAAAEIPVLNGIAVAVWEITAANPSILEAAVFGVGVAYGTDTVNRLPGLGQSSVSGNFAPFYASGSDAGRMSSFLPIPRFVDALQTTNAFRIDACVTNLLFPFVTNQASFDTGIAVSNTSRDPFGSTGRMQSGLCTVNYYGSTPPNAPALRPQTTNSPVAPGTTMAFVVSSGGSHGITGTPGFQGYLIVQCDFRYAHGFAFITDGPIGSARVAEGYLGLVMDAGSLSRGSLTEILAH